MSRAPRWTWPAHWLIPAPMKARQGLLFAVRKKPRARRKPRGARYAVPHRRRDELDARHPVHVTVRLAEGLPSLRGKGTFAVVRECLRRAKERLGAPVVHFAVLGNHVHLIVEAEGRSEETRLNSSHVKISYAVFCL